jgi:hypothetical protein
VIINSHTHTKKNGQMNETTVKDLKVQKYHIVYIKIQKRT